MSSTVKYMRKIPNLDCRLLRALLHRAWKAGNDSMNLPHEPAGELERHNMINDLLLEHGFAKPK